MSVDTKYFRKISIPKDGDCLFRCLVLFINDNLVHCRRNRYGLPTNKEYSEYETSCTKFLRKSVVRMIKSRQIRYSAPKFYDNERYNSIEERIEKMEKSGEFGGKLEMDIISRMYKINIHVFIPFDGDYSCIYKTDSENHIINLHNVVDDHDSVDSDGYLGNEYEYSDGRFCFLLLDGENYSLLEPNYIEIKKDFPPTEVMETGDTIEENVKITITDRRCLSNYPSGSEISDNSILNSSHNTSIMFDDFEQINTAGDIVVPREHDIAQKVYGHQEKLNSLLEDKKNAILVHSEGGSKLLELRESYKTLSFNDLFDIISSIEKLND
jgi:hypothetical protein